jgi:hypothetical protein
MLAAALSAALALVLAACVGLEIASRRDAARN